MPVRLAAVRYNVTAARFVGEALATVRRGVWAVREVGVAAVVSPVHQMAAGVGASGRQARVAQRVKERLQVECDGATAGHAHIMSCRQAEYGSTLKEASLENGGGGWSFCHLIDSNSVTSRCFRTRWAYVRCSTTAPSPRRSRRT